MGAVNVAITGVSLSWSTQTGATSYVVQAGTSSTFASTIWQQAGVTNGGSGISSWAPASFANNSTFYWEVASTNAGGTGVWSTIWSFTTIIGTPSLVTPENGNNVQSFTPILIWLPNSSGAAPLSYELQVSLNSSFSPNTYDNNSITTSTQQITLPSTYTTTYYWRVDASNANGPSAWTAIQSFTTVENYNNWTNHKTLTINTTASGANDLNTVYNFPVLVRLTTANAPGFGTNSGNDFRFSKTSYAQAFPYQLDYLSPTKDTAAVWVLVDTVLGNSASQVIVMHYGNVSASNASNGGAVFDTGNAFRGTWHLGETGGTNFSDATLHGVTGISENWTSTADTAGIIGRAQKFDSVSHHYITMGPGKTGITGNVPRSIEAWIKGNQSVSWNGIVGYMPNNATANTWFELEENASNPTDYCVDFYGTDYTSTTPTNDQAWHHVVGTYDGTTGRFYVDGVLKANGAPTSTQSTIDSFLIAWRQNGGSYFKGVIDEVRLSSTARSADWVNLSYQNQNLTDQTLLGYFPASPALVSPTNGALGQSATPTLVWNAATGATSYHIQISSSATFAGNTVYDQTGVTNPSWTSPTLGSYTNYWWRVAGSNNGTDGTWAGAWSFTTIAAFGAPPLASPSSGAVNQPTSPTLTWNGVIGANSYEIQISANNFASTIYDSVITNGSSLADLYSEAPLTNLTQYYWRVNAYSSAFPYTGPGSAGGGWSSVWTFTTVIAAPGAPTIAAPSSGAVNQLVSPGLTLSWNSASGGTVASYAVLVSTSSSFSSTVFSQPGITTGTSAVPTGISLNSTTYYWEVRGDQCQ